MFAATEMKNANANRVQKLYALSALPLPLPSRLLLLFPCGLDRSVSLLVASVAASYPSSSNSLILAALLRELARLLCHGWLPSPGVFGRALGRIGRMGC